ncbi:MAG TPA: ABC transporter ATP-binding protein [Bacillota bacterium]|jgi:putative ABC transport system ATP-binding protein|nr:macrolide ABC transporter ATP-binding protein [Clostridiales bacterium UBA9856]HOA42775.1 ABC transporter ATP-binding protein [Bacillota bacterium]HPZ59754.1 ABC transporter ATP-binding protein [Bacillota bacterium]HQC82728.1 ABC transporter ATP-binding protein [Bacillota bacterium]
MEILRVENLCKSYQMGEVEVKALTDASFSVEKGEFVVVLGPSGSGKSTLLNIIGGMDSPTSGKVFFKDEEITGFDDKKLTEYRRKRVGFVFQYYNVMANLTAEENVELAMEIVENPLPIDEVIEAVGLSSRRDHFPSQLSGGEQQRVSIARAIAKNPELLLCDEPTGALDYNTGISIMALLSKLNREMGKTLIVITHNSDIALMADRVIRMRSGQIIENTVNENPINAEEIKW